MEHYHLKKHYTQTSKTKATTLASMSKLEAHKQFITFMLKEIKKGIANDGTDNTVHPSGKSKGRAKQILSPSDHYAITESG